MVEADVTTKLSDDGTTLGIFLYHSDEDARFKAEEVLYQEGAQFTAYPSCDLPPVIPGSGVLVEDVTVSLWVGPLYLVAPLGLPHRELKAAVRAVLFAVRKPYDARDETKRNLLAATLPLRVLEREAT